MCCFEKYCLFAINILVWLAGVGLIIIGVVALVYPNSEVIQNNLPSKDTATTVGIILVAIGSVMFITGFFGCCGAYSGSTCLLVVYIILAGGLLVAQVAVLSLTIKYGLDGKSDEDTKQTLLNAGERLISGQVEINKFKDSLDGLVKCYSVDNNNNGKNIEEFVKNWEDSKKHCSRDLKTFIQDFLLEIIIIFSVIILIQATSFILGFCYCCSVRRALYSSVPLK